MRDFRLALGAAVAGMTSILLVDSANSCWWTGQPASCCSKGPPSRSEMLTWMIGRPGSQPQTGIPQPVKSLPPIWQDYDN
jgi:hypothetical protein